MSEIIAARTPPGTGRPARAVGQGRETAPG
jgi:hypothetical protein